MPRQCRLRRRGLSLQTLAGRTETLSSYTSTSCCRDYCVLPDRQSPLFGRLGAPAAVKTLPRSHLGLNDTFSLAITHQSSARACEPIDPTSESISQEVLTQCIYCLEVIFSGYPVNYSDPTLSQNLAVDCCRLLACNHERQARLPAFLGPADEDLLGQSAFSTRTEVVGLVDHQPDLLGI